MPSASPVPSPLSAARQQLTDLSLQLHRSFTLSPVYPAARAQLHSARGVSVRFPRFLRVRDDKAVENATTAAQLAGMYEAQMRDAPAFRPEAKAGGEEGEGERGEEKGEDAEDE